MTQTVEALRREARSRYQRGDLAAAVENQTAVINQTRSHPTAKDYLTQVLYLSTLGDFTRVIHLLQQGLKIWPDNWHFKESLAASLVRSGRFSEAVPGFEEILVRDPDNPNLHDGLAHAYGELGKMEKARHHGECSLLLKDAAHAPPEGMALKSQELPPFRSDAPERNIIAFSLWGGNFRYLDTAVRNAELAGALYPEWRCRFYVDETVPDFIRGQLLASGADVVMMDVSTLYSGLFWRFLVANDTLIDRFLCRDADSLINLRERAAVMEWVHSDRAFHVMRDDHAHTDPILAGMWGGVANLLPPLETLWRPYVENAHRGTNCDQKFLREIVWPLIREQVTIHDRVFRVFNAKPFPAGTDRAGSWHVGENHVMGAGRPMGELRSGNAIKQVRRKRFVFTITTGRSGTTFLTDHLRLNLNNAEIHHERGEAFHSHGWHTPDASHFMRFNSIGNLPDVRDFWRRKLACTVYGSSETYVETSHFLAKGGLIENLDLLGTDAEIHLVHLTRDIFDTAWSLANRFDFYNLGFTWLFYLDPRYPKNLVPSEDFGKHGMLGYALWYVHEMQARAEYYRRCLVGQPNIHFHEVDLTDLTKVEGAKTLLTAINPDSQCEQPRIPEQANASQQWHLGEKERQTLQQLVRGARVDYENIVEFALREQRLGGFWWQPETPLRASPD